MTDHLEVGHLLETLVEVSEGATGYKLTMPEVATWPGETNDEGSFRGVVSGLYVWMKEQWPSHIAFLMASARSVHVRNEQVRSLSEAVHVLRTSHQHRLDPNNARDAKTAQGAAKWFYRTCGAPVPSSEQEWHLCGAALYLQAHAGAMELLDTAEGIARDRELARQWARIFSRAAEVDLVAIRKELAQDLDLRFPSSTLGYIDRQINGRWGRLASRMNPEDDSDTTVRRITVRELTAAATPELPCGLDEILFRLGLGSGRQALQAVRLAQAVVERVAFDGADEFLDRLAAAWRAVESLTDS